MARLVQGDVEFVIQLKRGSPSAAGGLLPLDNIVEIGVVRSEGFIWLRQKKKKDHYFEQISRSVSFAAEITAFIEPQRMKKVTGVKAKELLLWIGVSEMLQNGTLDQLFVCATSGVYKINVKLTLQQQPPQLMKERRKKNKCRFLGLLL
ncbi:hypothetical protein EJ110_NYTH32638 [Nymphaea thermarum]|nr:hypothetical protein EJ110_NYTH32638 [Nymphaea thermarum]